MYKNREMYAKSTMVYIGFAILNKYLSYIWCRVLWPNNLQLKIGSNTSK